MDFLVNEVGWKPAEIARAPTVLLCSAKKDYPKLFSYQSSYIKMLNFKGLSQLLDVLNGKVSLAELGFKSEETRGRKTIVASQLRVSKHFV